MDNAVQRKRVLLIDDDEELGSALATFFKAGGFELVPVFDALHGVRFVKREHFDIIILDLKLLGGGGKYVFENLKSSLDTKRIPIIILSGRIQDDLITSMKKKDRRLYP